MGNLIKTNWNNNDFHELLNNTQKEVVAYLQPIKTNNDSKLTRLRPNLKNNKELKRTLTGHTSWVNDLTLLPNGDLASVSDDSTIKIWNPNNGTLQRSFSVYTQKYYNNIWLTALSNGDLASNEGPYIKIWNPYNGTLKRTLIGHHSDVKSLTTLPNGDLASGSDDETIKIWNPNDGKLKRTLRVYSGSVVALKTFPNGDLASYSDGEVNIWNPNDGSLKRTLSEKQFDFERDAWPMIILPNDDLAIGTGSLIQIWDSNNGTLKRTLSVERFERFTSPR